MATAHFFLGDKGGTGKSTTCRTVIQYYLDRNVEFALFDADRSNPDVKRIYSNVGCQTAVFSENEKYEDQANSIYFSAIRKPTLVNFPAQILNPLKEWFERNDLFELAKEDGVEFVFWFVCNGGYDSLNLLNLHFQYFDYKVNYVLVKNWGLCDDWESLDTNDFLQSKIQEYGVKVIDFPKFIGMKTKNFIDEKSLTFSAAREHKDFNSIDRQRVKSFLKKSYQEFDNAGIFQVNKQVKVIKKKEENNRLVENRK